MGSHRVTLTEGREGLEVTLQATAPPYVLCRDHVVDSDQCTIALTVS
jgi:hypothetical protein